MLFYKLVINHSFQKCTPRWWRVETTSPCRRWVGNLAGLMQLGLCAVGYKILTIAIWRSFDRVWIPCHFPNCKLDYSITCNLRLSHAKQSVAWRYMCLTASVWFKRISRPRSGAWVIPAKVLWTPWNGSDGVVSLPSSMSCLWRRWRGG